MFHVPGEIAHRNSKKKVKIKEFKQSIKIKKLS